MEDNNEQPTQTTPVTPPVETPAEPVSTPPAEVVSTPPGESDAKKPAVLKKILWGVIVLVCIFGAAYGAYKVTQQKADKKTSDLNSQIALLESNEHTLPAGTTKISDCIPNMGYHYIMKSSDPEYGPFLLLNKKNKVIGVEYMAAKAMYEPIPKTDPPVELITKDSPMFGWKFDHAEVSHLPKGHEGLLVEHVDIHLYTVTVEQQKQACI